MKTARLGEPEGLRTFAVIFETSRFSAIGAFLGRVGSLRIVGRALLANRPDRADGQPLDVELRVGLNHR